MTKEEYLAKFGDGPTAFAIKAIAEDAWEAALNSNQIQEPNSKREFGLSKVVGRGYKPGDQVAIDRVSEAFAEASVVPGEPWDAEFLAAWRDA